jgi:protein gp37
MATKIEWTDWTWNPWWGCSDIAPESGKHAPSGASGICYAALFASRGLHAQFRGVAAGGRWTGKLIPAGGAVWRQPHRWRCGRVFTCSMSDFWHEGVPLEWLNAALDVIEATPHLTYQVLTKRPGNVNRRLANLKRRLPANVWLGVTVGHHQSLPLLKPLRRIEATLRFLSVEPLLTSVVPGLNLADIGWVITGGQSGPGAAGCDPEWVREVRDLCQQEGVPLFHKQWGTWASNPTPRHLELDPSAKGGATLDGRLWREFPA